MARFEERNRRSLKDLIKEGKAIDIFRNPQSNKLTVVMDGVYLGIDHRVKEIVEEVADADEKTKKKAFKHLVNQCSVAELRQIDENGKPAVVGFNDETGKIKYAEFVPCLVLDTMSQNMLIRLDSDFLSDNFLIEQDSNYAYRLKHMDNPSFDKVRDLSIKFFRELPQELQDELYESMKRGVDVLDSEPQMTAYMFSFGKMHQAKLKYAFGKLPDGFMQQKEINIIDYGCGQAMGIMCYADYLREKLCTQKVKVITLIEPSEICLKRAALHASVFFPEAEIKTICKKFDVLNQGDLSCNDETPTLHILSNVLDMPSFDLEKFSKLIRDSLTGYNQFVCVGPYFKDYDRDIRMVKFSSHFSKEAIGIMLDKRELLPDKDWTCALSVFSVGETEKTVEEDLTTRVTDEDLANAVEDEFGVFYSEDGKRLLKCKNKDIKKYTIKNNTKIICNRAFANCSSLDQIDIPDSVISIGVGSFVKCKSLSQISIPNSVTSIRGDAFRDCSALRQINLSDSLSSIECGTFAGCSLLKSFSIPNSIKSIGDGAFSECLSLQDVNIPNSVTIIGRAAFSNCSSLTSIVLPNSVTSIGDWAFSNCSSLQQCIIPSSVKLTGVDIFHRCIKLTIDKNSSRFIIQNRLVIDNENSTTVSYIGEDAAIIIPDTVNRIGYETFRGCASLKQVFIPNSVTSIGPGAFSNCTSLLQIAIPEMVSHIEHNSFRDCVSLRQVNICDSVKSIDSFAFWNCSSLQAIPIPDSVLSIGDCAFGGCLSVQRLIIPSFIEKIGTNPFLNCNKLVLESNSSRFVMLDGFLIDNQDNHIISYTGNDNSIKIPDFITSIGTNAFMGCSSLEHVIMPDSITSIKHGTFRDCSALQKITIPNSVTDIGMYAFRGCKSLKEVVIPSSITIMCFSAFNDCESLQKIFIPRGYTKKIKTMLSEELWDKLVEK